jgi:hypothetical protein
MLKASRIHPEIFVAPWSNDNSREDLISGMTSSLLLLLLLLCASI